ncbi:MAG: NAD kinase [Sporocytophaga sp.]|uniref:NAD kinase n=1 Tax=Sporocytophaga sp. TaxID=2231183 RepID=UPI001AFD8AA5|nr:NAD kinase [Sporocytophaga sp.]MBO9702322.1 NAD kinase [Sporocytophaga sp.]
MKIAIHGRTFNNDAIPFIQEMFDNLKSRESEIQVYKNFSGFLDKVGIKYNSAHIYSRHEELEETDFLFSIGGDGTFLESVSFAGPQQIPLLGINTGRLGFLATTPREKILQAIDSIYKHTYKFEERTLIHLDSDIDLFNGVNFALNEFAILKRDISSMIVVHTYINGEYLNSYWADGLIISTPTGSTGYSLSCGGPLVMPSTNNFIISPVSPHNLNVRPMIVPDSSVLSFEIEARNKNFLISLDSRSKSVPVKTKLTVRRERFKAKIVELEGYNYFQTLRNKLNWGLDLRN